MLRSLVSRSGAISRAAGALSASTASAAPRGLIPRARLYSTAGGHGHHAATEEASGRRLATAALVTGSVFLGLYMSSPDASERKVARRKATPVAPAAAEEPAEEAATHVVETKVAVPEKKVEAVVVKRASIIPPFLSFLSFLLTLWPNSQG